jgi:hypothetical protein
MNPLSINPLVGLAGLALAAAIGFSTGWTTNGWRLNAEIQAIKAKHTATENKAITDHLTQIEQEQTAHELDRQKLKKGHADEIARSRALSAAAPGLRVGPEICRGFAGQAKTEGAGGSDGGDPATRLVPPGIDADFRALGLKIEAIFAGCRVAQQHLEKNGMAP